MRKLFGSDRHGTSPWGAMSSFNEAFRILSANLDAALDGLDRPTVVVTSSKADEGKTVTCAKLAASFAARGQRVVLVDLDLRNPGAHLAVGGHNHFGATDVLQGRRKLSDSLQYIGLPQREGFGDRGLFLVAAGHSVTEPNELLSLPRTGRMLDALAAQSDLVLIDSPPVLAVADSLTVAREAGAAIVVVDARRTNADALQRTRDLLRRNQTTILGLVLNQVHAGDASVSAKDGYGYGNGAPAGPNRSGG
ncbi:MAG: CpsD/CapB family tyrosine-protein kinase [Actinomycetota bacterium]|nr:CpsD/CapB family tyrosine-protein kinase [Actinomycetota bacterium]